MALNEIIKEIESLKRDHYKCDDSFYSCKIIQMHNYINVPGYEIFCDCSADKTNQKIDQIIKELKEILK